MCVYSTIKFLFLLVQTAEISQHMALLSSPIAQQHTHTTHPHSTLFLTRQFGMDMCACVVKAECPLTLCRSVSVEWLQERIKTSRPDRDKVTTPPPPPPSIRHLSSSVFHHSDCWLSSLRIAATQISTSGK